MDVYSPEISTKYGEVFWTMMDPVPLDKDVIDKFSGKIMAVVGYETDQVNGIYVDWLSKKPLYLSLCQALCRMIY